MPSRILNKIRNSLKLQVSILLFPSSMWLILFFLCPLIIVMIYSLLQRGVYGGIVWNFTIENYTRLVDKLYLAIFMRSFYLAVSTTIICLAISFPFAYFITKCAPKWRNLLLVLVVIPFWTNFLVRTYAWIVILRTEGVINSLLSSLRIFETPLELLYRPATVLMGLVYGYLPFMILPLYASLEKQDPALVEAANDLGANALKSFLYVTLPLSMPGVVAGSILVFIPSMGAYITPVLLGGAKSIMVGNLIENQFLTVRDWPFGSAISLLLMAVVLAAVIIYFKVVKSEEL
jgi:spermidine/putrescine transport system permease protein